MTQLLTYIPFLTPLPVDRWWLVLLLPLALALAVVYKAIRLEELAHLPREASSLAARIVGLMAAVAAVLWLLSEIM